MFKNYFIIQVLVIFLIGIFLVPQFSYAQSSEEKNLEKVEFWINSIVTLSARFIQVAQDGNIDQGNLYLRRPGLMHFQYDPPSQMLIVTDGFSLHVYDKELDEATSWPIAATPLRPLLLNNVRISKDYTYKFIHSEKLLQLTLIDPVNPDQGSLTLIFREEPFELYQWVVIDSIGLSTVIELTNLSINSPIPQNLFTFDDPRTRPVDSP